MVRLDNVITVRSIAAFTVLLAALIFSALSANSTAQTNPQETASSATVLVYHRFGAIAGDSMTVTTTVFEWQLKFLHDHGYTIVPLREVVNFAAGHGNLPPRAVAITADDGHRTVFTDMKPLVERGRIPVTLFIYPSAISNASYAMTWGQLAELKATGLFDIESHTYWHPNFRTEKKRLSPDEYRKFVDMQLRKSRLVLQRKLDAKADMLAWPFGIYDDELIASAADAGYVAAFTIERRPVSRGGNVMAIPRYIVTNGDTGRSFEMLLTKGDPSTAQSPD